MKPRILLFAGATFVLMASLGLVGKVLPSTVYEEVTSACFACRAVEVLLAGACLIGIASRLRFASRLTAALGLALLEAHALCRPLPAVGGAHDTAFETHSTWQEMTRALRGEREAALRLVSKSAQEGADMDTVTRFCALADRHNGWRAREMSPAAQDSFTLCQILRQAPHFAVAGRLRRLNTPDAQALLAGAEAEMRSACDRGGSDESPSPSSHRGPHALLTLPTERFENGVSHFTFDALTSLQAAMPGPTLYSPKKMGFGTRGGPGEVIVSVDRALQRPVVVTASPRADALGLVLPELASNRLGGVRLKLRATPSFRVEVEYESLPGDARREEQFACETQTCHGFSTTSCSGNWDWVVIPFLRETTSERLVRVTLWGDFSLAEVLWEKF